LNVSGQYTKKLGEIKRYFLDLAATPKAGLTILKFDPQFLQKKSQVLKIMFWKSAEQVVPHDVQENVKLETAIFATGSGVATT
jgi:hypothetical protein